MRVYPFIEAEKVAERNVAKVAAGRKMLQAVFYVLRDGQATFLTATPAAAAQAA